MGRARRNVIASLVAWGIVTLAYAALLTANYSAGDLGCEDPAGSSNYGHAVWQWWPPGTTCRYVAIDLPQYGLVRAHDDRPSSVAGVTAIALIAWPLVTVLLARRAGRSGRTSPTSRADAEQPR